MGTVFELARLDARANKQGHAPLADCWYTGHNWPTWKAHEIAPAISAAQAKAAWPLPGRIGTRGAILSATAPQATREHSQREPLALRHMGRAAVQLGLAVGLDAALIAIAGGGAVGLRLLANGTRLGRLKLWGGGGQLYLLCGLCWIVLLMYENVYRRDLQSADQGDQLMKALTVGLVAAIVLSFAMHISNELSRSVLFFWYGLNLLLLTLVRPLLRRWVVRRPLVLVAAEKALSTHPSCAALQKLGFRTRVVLLGAGPPPGREAVDAVVLCLEPKANAAAVLANWERFFPEVAIFAGATAVTPLGAQPVNLHGVQLYTLRHPLDQPLNRMCKRCFDLVGAALLLLATAPLLALLFVAIKLDSRGPAFYRQRRLGRYSTSFQILKFRSMRSDAEEHLLELLCHDPEANREYETTFKLKNDPRITRVGRWLRRYSLDELPQLWNVLAGEMSLVGPRPIVDAEVALYEEAYPIVSSVCPGMTGVWQTSGRSDVTYESRRGFDVAYVRDWSLWRDISILMRTVAAVALPNGY